ncbi:MAG: hypothetical protein HQK77_14690 [Desulfobacterales bacterium]|nr:hypothetical protein [Desulfobacterales bacterium]
MNKSTANSIKILFAVFVLAGLYYASVYSYLLFHTLVELFVIAVAISIFLIVLNVRRLVENDYFIFIGIAFAFIGIIDLLHTLAYKGMNIFYGYSANLPTQLWIIWQYLYAGSMLLAPFFIFRKNNFGVIFSVFFVGVGLSIIAVFSGYFPDCFIEGSGLTPFKKISEILTSFMLILAIILHWKVKQHFIRVIFIQLVVSILMSIIAKLFFIFYINVYGISNLIGHYFMLISFYIIYDIFVAAVISNPLEFLFIELKIMAKHLRTEKNQLEKMVKERTVELEHANKQLQREISERKKAQTLLLNTHEALKHSYAQLEEFTHIVSHDLREPLRGIYNLTRIFVDDYSQKLSDEHKSIFDIILRQCRRQEHQILLLQKYSSVGQLDLYLEETDIHAVVQEMIQLLKSTKHYDTVDFCIHNSLPTVRCDKERAADVFQNLILNAIKYNNKTNKKVEIGYHNQYLIKQFYVKDNGIGIDPKYHQEIFRMFYRLHNHDEYGGGLGAGLAITKKIIEQHGGKIWINSTPDEGTEFIFNFGK